MRGDSLRDFYAKTLAVLGLGLLAGAGAAVDYWPTGSTIPQVASPVLPTPGRPVLAQHLDLKIPAPAMPAPRAEFVRSMIHAKNVGTARFLSVTPKPIETAEPAPAPVAPVPELLVAPLATDWQALLPEVEIASSSLLVLPPQNAAPATGIIGGALRRTKDSLLKTGAVTGNTLAVTGNTIADAVKGVFGAFKKVSPF